MHYISCMFSYDMYDVIRLSPSEVWLPKWLRGDRERQLTGFVHPATADGLMKAGIGV